MDTYSEMKRNCKKITEDLDFEALKKVIFIFPGELKLYEIAFIVFRSFHKYVREEPIEKVISDLSFDVIIIDHGSFGSEIIVKSRSLDVK